MTHFNYKTGVYKNNGVPTAVGSCQKKHCIKKNQNYMKKNPSGN